MSYDQGGPGAPDPGGPPGQYVPPAPPPPPGPGMMPPGQYPMGPPPPAKSSSAWVWVLVGCGVVFLIGVLAAGGTCYYMARKAPNLVSGAMGLAKSQFISQLTPDHTDEQIERFESLYDAVFTEEMERLGFIEWAQNYETVMDKLNRMAGDGVITVEESTQWCDDAYYALEENGYWEE